MVKGENSIGQKVVVVVARARRTGEVTATEDRVSLGND